MGMGRGRKNAMSASGADAQGVVEVADEGAPRGGAALIGALGDGAEEAEQGAVDGERRAATRA
jgi:hypothetical protein